MVVAAASWFVWKAMVRRWLVATACASLLALVLTLINWDSRSPWSTFSETYALTKGPLPSRLISREAEVWVEGGAPAAWLVLKRPHFYSFEQAGAAPFSRKLAEQISDRHPRVNALRDLIEHCRREATAKACVVPADSLALVCRVNPDLKWIVLATPGSTAPDEVIEDSDPTEDHRLRMFAYSCERLRQLP